MVNHVVSSHSKGGGNVGWRCVVCSLLVSLCRTRFEGYEAAAAAAAEWWAMERDWEDAADRPLI